MAGDDGTDDGEDRQPEQNTAVGPSPRDKTEGEREQIKLQAGYMNGIAVGVFIVGGFTIPTSIILSSGDLVFAAIFAPFCFLLSFGLHKVAKSSLKELDR
ncbi:hypothetical protein [Jiella avicenniae]|uniref:Uncharacterized protein n=1 Tax=Jiella avicenniae TaxID=2907202 RepID=A0A9X1P2W4_9HYPH|nr:hypothetical protein [Jiella avicenniae]MCE7030062.1 hypothetical protein [Jiella avicenniae]